MKKILGNLHLERERGTKTPDRHSEQLCDLGMVWRFRINIQILILLLWTVAE